MKMLRTLIVQAALVAAFTGVVLGAQSRLVPETTVLPARQRAGLIAQVEANSQTIFTISGSVSGLFPGARSELPLTLANTGRHDIEVTAVRASVGEAATGCSASTLSITDFVGRVIVKARGTALVSLPVVMSSGAPDACQGATYPLTYVGDAKPAGQR